MFTPKDPCQSCSMPLSKDPNRGGTHSDGTLSTEYCSFCYQDGAFIEPDITVEMMVNKVDSKLQEMWIPGFMRKWFTNGIPNLKRWSNSARRVTKENL